MSVKDCSVVLLVVLICYVQAYTDEEVKKTMLKLHNDLRKRIRNCTEEGVPPAIWMPLLTWNDELAEKAKNWSKQCTVSHDSKEHRLIPKFFWVGQNCAGASTLEQAFNLWLGEKKYYDHQTGNCTKVCGHYKQLVWAKTTELGCAATECPKPNFIYGLSIVCNYGLGGNLNGELPFQVGGKQYCGGSRT